MIPFSVRALSCREAYAEKFRAALTRRDPAIRDFYDIDYGHRKSLFDVDDPAFLTLVRKKLSVVNDATMLCENESLEALRRQIVPHLAPVLREPDLVDFDLDRAWRLVQRVATAAEKEEPCQSR